MGIPFTILMGIPLTITMGFLFTMVVGIQFTVSTYLYSKVYLRNPAFARSIKTRFKSI
jgi:hypothetical protein